MAATAALAASRSKRSGSESSPAHAPISSRAWPGGPASISLRSANPPVPPESSGGQAPRSKELLPRRAGAAGRGADSGGVQDLPHSGGDDRVAGLDQFALYAPVPPRRRRVEIREVPPDPVYNSTLVEKFVNSMMWQGKKTV